VQDYLLSGHFKDKFKRDLSGSLSHTFISRTCISYLLYFGTHHLETLAILNYPLAEYSAVNWCYHLLRSHDRNSLFAPAMRLLEDGSEQFSAFIRSRRFSPYDGGRCSWTSSALLFCCGEGYIEGVQCLLATRIEVNPPGGVTPLWIASANGHADIVSLLLAHSTDVDLGGREDGKTALSAASQGGHTEIVHLLLEHGADINLPGGEYGSALAAASHHGHIEIVRLLLKGGANTNLPAGLYGSALTAACHRNHLEIVRLLLDAGAEVNLRGGGYGNALSTASRRARIDIVRLLLDAGADVNLLGGEDRTALMAACHRGEIQIVRLLLENGADINLECGGEYYNALSAASCSCSSNFRHDIVCLLLDNGADIKSLGSKALKMASKGGYDNIVALLREKGATSESEEDYFATMANLDSPL
jgi:ankyrin repeat protein